MKPSKIGSITERGIHGLTQGGYWVSGIVLILLMLLVAADVIGRYVFSSPITGAMEIDELMMVLLVFLALAYCTLEKGHISVELVISRLSGRNQAILDCITSFISAAMIAIIAWQLGSWGWHQLLSSSGRLTLLLTIPQAPFILVASLGCLLMCLELLIGSFRSLARAASREIKK